MYSSGWPGTPFVVQAGLEFKDLRGSISIRQCADGRARPWSGSPPPWQQLHGLGLLSGGSPGNRPDWVMESFLLSFPQEAALSIRIHFRARKMYSDKMSKG